MIVYPLSPLEVFRVAMLPWIVAPVAAGAIVVGVLLCDWS